MPPLLGSEMTEVVIPQKPSAFIETRNMEQRQDARKETVSEKRVRNKMMRDGYDMREVRRERVRWTPLALAPCSRELFDCFSAFSRGM